VTQTVKLIPYAYTGKSRTGMRSLQGVPYVPYNGDSVNIDTHRGIGESWPSKGYKIKRLIASAVSKSCATWLHTHTDGGSTPIYYLESNLYAETGSDSPTGFTGTAITETFRPVFVNMGPPFGGSVLFNGINGEAQLIRENGSNVMEAVDFDMAAPASAGTVTTPANATALIAGTYHLAVTFEDDGNSGATPTVESGPYYETSITVVAGDSIDLNITALSPDSRVTHWNVYVSEPATSGGTATDSPSSYLLESDSVAIGTKTVSITALSGTTSLSHQNEDVRTAVMPLSAVDRAWLHDGRLFIASSLSNKVYFSERDNLNHWHSLDEVIAGTESGWSDTVMGGISAFGSMYVFTRRSIHRVTGEFKRDDQGTNATYILLVQQHRIAENFGLVGPNAVVQSAGGGPSVVYFLSEQGLAALRGEEVALVSPDDEAGQLDRIDNTYLENAVLASDPNGYICVLVTRLANSSRPMDGASLTGMPDRIYRWDTRHNVWACPLALGDITHIIARSDPTAGGTSSKIRLMAGSPTGRVLQLNYGNSGGGPDDVSGTLYDGQAGTSATTTTETFVEAGVSNDQFNGMTVTLKYPDDDTVYPGQTAIKTITDTVVSGSSVTVHWVGALTVPSASGAWTVRIAGHLKRGDLALDMAQVMQLPPDRKIKFNWAKFMHQHVIGVDSVS
jgi:hypothetical protein